MKRNNTGSALVDYIVPTALVGIVVGLGLFGILKSGVLANFFAASGNIDINSGKAVMNSNNPSSQPLVSSFGTENITSSAVPDKPLIKGGGVDILEGGAEIDFGDFVLKGIPEDFGDYIEATGNSGGTELLANLLRQIANEANLDSETQNLITQLANHGHSIAGVEAEIESIAEKGIAEINSSGETTMLWDMKEVLTSLDDGDERSNFGSTLSQITSNMAGSSDPETQAVYDSVKLLADEILGIADQVSDLAGPTIDTTGAEASSALEGILEPDGSKRTDLDSALICTSGDGKDSGTNCN